MPLNPEEFYSHAMQAADAEGRLSLSRMAYWEVFPFEPDGLQVVPLAPPVVPEPPRFGEDGENCAGCTPDQPAVWSDEHWRLTTSGEPTGVPLLLVLQPREHFDLPDLPDERARELGVLTVHIARAIEGLSHVARAHVSKWGDGGAHLHVFFYARPEGFSQLRGTCLAVWDDLLPPVPRDVRDRDAAIVAQVLATSYGGTAHDGSD